MEHRKADGLIANECEAHFRGRRSAEQLLTERGLGRGHAIAQFFVFGEPFDHSQNDGAVVCRGRNATETVV